MKNIIKAIAFVALVSSSSASAIGIGGGVTGSAGLEVGTTGIAASGSASGTASSSNGLQLGLNAQAGLDSQIKGGVSTEVKKAILELRSDAEAAIKSSADLDAYNQVVVEERPRIKTIEVGKGVVAVQYIQQARLLGIFPSSVKGKVEVAENGEVAVKMPWWSFFYAKKTADVEAAVSAAVKTQGKLDLNGKAEAALRKQARLVNAVTAAVQASAEASVEADPTEQN
jgi:hypothetical protein